MILPGSPINLVNGSFLWFSDGNPAVPILGDGTFSAGDLLLVLSASNLPLLYRCTASGLGGTATWDIVSQAGTITPVAAAYAALQSDGFIVQSTANAITLPTSATTPVGKQFTVTLNGAASCTVVVAGAGLIGHAHHTVTLGAEDSAVTLINDGTQYQVVSSTGTITYS